jgi:hypothetical protein
MHDLFVAVIFDMKLELHYKHDDSVQDLQPVYNDEHSKQLPLPAK